MRTKHFVNDPTALVVSALKSFQLINPALSVDTENKILYAPSEHDRISIVSGGGAGHEPSFTGFVGAGLLTAAVSGTVFASPSSRQVLTAIENVNASKGILVVLMNYTGDVLNFGVALEKAKAANPALRTEMLVVGDDVSVVRSRAGRVGRRGIAGTVLVAKVTGAMASVGYDLDTIVRVGRLVANNLGSIGACLDRVHVPGTSKEDTDNLVASDEVELGMGIHNEFGCGRRNASDAELPSLIAEMLQQILDVNDPERNFLQTQTREVIVLVNNLGALSVLELGAVVTEVADQLERRYQKDTIRIYSGTFMTSLDGAGFSISLLNAVETGVEESLAELLDAPCNAFGWHGIARSSTSTPPQLHERAEMPVMYKNDPKLKSRLDCNLDETVSCLRAGLESVVASESEITRYDSIVGDGDCGTTLKRGAQGILNLLETLPLTDVVSLLTSITSSIESNMDGTSGALYAIFLNNLTRYFKSHAHEPTTVNSGFWSDALDTALAALGRYTPATVGDRTLMDALIPFTTTLRTAGLHEASLAAREGAEKTRFMRPGLGRSVYIGNEDRWLGKIPDPGAWGLSKLFEGLVRG
ncbi:dihydroxyacetone kinase [Boeremia exigua]|uniref:dihydroxyacetone kinase n=1 Tax=Boeremia exigua TaxID=749465 RepID=UPI001E8D3C94|nr:dihydroxyacetone kinase [Boeremia exigua]KAH6613007.1 dihydroxyacetone kinase [Boeremia exigua]